MGIIKFALELGAVGSSMISSIRVDDEFLEIKMQLFCEGCGIPTKTFTIGSSNRHEFRCEECRRIGTMKLENMVKGFNLPCNKKKQEVAMMICSQFVPHDEFLKVKGVFTVTDAGGGEHELIMYSSEKRLLEDLQGIGTVKVEIVHDFVRINK